MSERAPAEDRNAFRAFSEITTRWLDNDAYGHVNNVVYYSYFDTAVTGHLIRSGCLDPKRSNVIGLVVETQCRYFKPIEFPDLVIAGLRVARIGHSSVRYEIGLFRNDDTDAAAQGHFIHVYVDRETNTPVPLPESLRKALDPLVVAR